MNVILQGYGRMGRNIEEAMAEFPEMKIVGVVHPGLFARPQDVPGAVRAAEAMPEADGWAVIVSYKTLAGLHIEPLERQRGGARLFATLDAVARTLRAAGVGEFRVINPRSGAGSSDGR